MAVSSVYLWTDRESPFAGDLPTADGLSNEFKMWADVFEGIPVLGDNAQRSDAANDEVYDSLALSAGETSLRDRIHNLINEGEYSKACDHFAEAFLSALDGHSPQAVDEVYDIGVELAQSIGSAGSEYDSLFAHISELLDDLVFDSSPEQDFSAALRTQREDMRRQEASLHYKPVVDYDDKPFPTFSFPQMA